MKKSLHFGFLRNYLCFAAVVMVLLIPIYLEAFHLLEKEAEENIYEGMEQGMELLSDEIQSINSIIIRFPTNQYYAYVRSLKEPEQSSDYYALYSIKNYLADLTSSLLFPTQTMVWFSNGILMTPETVYSRPEQKSFLLFGVSDDQDVSRWFEDIAAEEHRYQFIETRQFRDTSNRAYTGLPLVHTYAAAGNRETVVFVSVFDVNTIYDLMGLQEMKEMAHVTIKDTHSGGILYENQVVSGEESSIRIEAADISLPFTITAEIPKHYFTSQLEGMWRIAFLYLMVFLLAAVVMAVILARKTAVPVHKIAALLKRYSEGNDQKEPESYQEIESYIEKIGDKGLAILDAHDRLHTEMYQWLLREQIVNGLEGSNLLKAAKLNREFPAPFRLVVMQVNEHRKRAAADDVTQLLRASGLEPLFFCKAKTNLFVMLVETMEQEKLKEKLKEMIQRAEETCDYGMIVFVSGEMADLTQLHERYLAGRYNMKYLSVQKLIFQDELNVQGESRFSELNLIENVKLTDLILSGSKEEARTIISWQWYQVSIAREYSLIEQLYYMQAAVLNSVALKLNCEKRAGSLEENDVITDIESRMLEFTDCLCDISKQRKQDKKNNLPRTIVEYIDSHYTDPDFYLGTLVEVFGLSDKTISKMIRSYCSCGFSEYLEGLRIQKARTLLENPKLSIETIARQSGFGLENTFYKAFKRVYNVSPSTYRANLNYLKQEEQNG